MNRQPAFPCGGAGTRLGSLSREKIALEMIEVQSGAYLGDDDIICFEDTYGRSSRPTRLRRDHLSVSSLSVDALGIETRAG
jgi:hypothetical protein